MDAKDIIGGVSPLKQRQKTRGGKYAKSATATSKRRGGFRASKGEWGGGGRNVGGYNVQTSFRPGPAWVKPANAGIGTTIKPKPTIAQELLKNELITGEGIEYKKDPDEVTTTTKRKSGGSFKTVWDKNKDNFQDKWKDKGGFEAWKKQAQKEIDAGYYKTETKTIKGQKYKRTYKTENGVRVPGSESQWTKV